MVPGPKIYFTYEYVTPWTESSMHVADRRPMSPLGSPLLKARIFIGMINLELVKS